MSTQRYDVTKENWQLVSTGPCFIQLASQNSALVHIGDTQPGNNAPAFHLNDDLSYPGARNVYVRAVSKPSNVVVLHVT